MKPAQALEALATAIQNATDIPPCQVSDPDAWFTDEDDNWQSYRQAKALCGMCPVKKECLIYAVVAIEPFGIWGGLSPAERKTLRSKQARGLSHQLSHQK